MIGSIIQGMVIDMNETRLGSLEPLQAFVDSRTSREDARRPQAQLPADARRRMMGCAYSWNYLLLICRGARPTAARVN